MLLRVTQYGEKILRQQGEPITTFDDSLRELAENMIETMYANEGIGLAAQQIGENIQLFVLDLQVRQADIDFQWSYDERPTPLDLIMPMACVNTQLLETPGPVVGAEEGCLSFPGIRAEVPRPGSIHARFQDLQGNPHTLKADGIFARVIQHELDHTKGVLFIDHVSKPNLARIETKLKKLRRKTRDFLKSASNA